jgi:hypothetical protein
VKPPVRRALAELVRRERQPIEEEDDGNPVGGDQVEMKRAAGHAELRHEHGGDDHGDEREQKAVEREPANLHAAAWRRGWREKGVPFRAGAARRRRGWSAR